MANLHHINLKLGEAQAFVQRWHRHSKPLKRHMFSIGAYSKFLIWNDSGQSGYPLGIQGIATVDRCSSAWSKDRYRIEIRRVCLSETAPDNMASFLISKAKAACFAMGYRQVVTYTQPHESGVSLRACGFRLDDYNVKRFTDGTVEGLLRWVCDNAELTDYGREKQKERLQVISDFVGEPTCT